jgi:hypothetical protein
MVEHGLAGHADQLFGFTPGMRAQSGAQTCHRYNDFNCIFHNIFNPIKVSFLQMLKCNLNCQIRQSSTCLKVFAVLTPDLFKNSSRK